MTAAQTKSLSARKATRKTYTAAESLEISLRNNEVLQERIADLEAELAETKDSLGQTQELALKAADERASLKAEVEALRGGQKALLGKLQKAEAEVERLKRERDWWHNAGCSPDSHHPTHAPPGPNEPHGEGMLGNMCRAQHSAFERAMRERSGRESGTPGGGTSPSGVSPSPPPAEFCPECGAMVPLHASWCEALKGRRKAAAEPAAPRHYEDCICVECESARKERDG